MLEILFPLEVKVEVIFNLLKINTHTFSVTELNCLNASLVQKFRALFFLTLIIWCYVLILSTG